MSGYRIKGLANEKNKTTGYRIKGLADENQDQKGFGAIASDIAGLPKQVAKGLYKFVLETGIGVPSAVKQLTNKDSTLHSIGNVAAGAFTTARDIANIPSSLQSYLEGKLGSIPEAIKNSPLKYTSMAGLNIPHIPEDLGIEQTLGLDTRNRGDVTLRNLGSLIPLGHVLKLSGKRSKTLAGLSKATTKATEDAAQAEADLNIAKETAKSNPDIKTAEKSAIRAKIAQAERDKQKLLPVLEQAIPEPHPFEDIRRITNSDLTDALQSEEVASSSRNNLGHALARRIYNGFSNDVAIAESYRNNFNVEKQNIRQLYDQVQSEFQNENLTLPRTQGLAEREEIAKKQLREAQIYLGDDELSRKRIDQAVSSLGEERSTTVPAAQVLSNYRTMQSTANDLRDRAYAPGSPLARNKDLQANVLAQADQLDVTASQLEQLIIDHGLGNSLNKLKTAGELWGSRIASRYGNPIHNKLYYKRQGPEDISKAIRGHERGNVLIREFIQSDPELVRHILGQRHGSNIDTIHDFDEISQDYIKHADQETQALLHAHAQSLSRHAEAVNRRQQAERSHKSAVDYIKEQKNIAQKREKEIAKAMTDKDLASKSHAELDRILTVLKDTLDTITNKQMQVNTTLEQKFKAAQAEKEIKDRIGMVEKYAYKGINLLYRVKRGKFK